MGQQPGDLLLHYRLDEPIGEGGMGVVWRAHDTTLGRDVALKLLPEAFTADPERCARFEREARALAALTHPHVAAVHGLHRDGEQSFLVMELVPGDDLDEVLARGPLPQDEVVAVARQIASALEAAHTKGIVHRDLKPGNVKLGPDGQVKVLDFGLAKVLEASTQEGDAARASHLPTVTSAGRAGGGIIGTPAYMAPEQARGKSLDRRVDLWAFGCVVFEMLSGRRAFPGDTISDTLASVLRGVPDWDVLPAETPRALRDLLRRCLAKDPGRRWRDAGDAIVVLDEVRAGEGREDAPAARGARRVPWPMAVALALLAGLALGAFLPNPLIRDTNEPPRVLHADLPIPEGWFARELSLSPDGRYAALVLSAYDPGPGQSGLRLALRRLDEPEFRIVDGSLGALVARFSPDSREIAYVALEHPGTNDAALVRAPVGDPGRATLVTEWGDRWMDAFAWRDQSEIVVVQTGVGRLLRYPTDGRPPPEPVKILGETEPVEAILLESGFPGGDLLGTQQVWEGGYHQSVVRVDPDTGAITTLLERAFEPHLVGDDLVVATRGDQLIALPYDAASGRVLGAARTVASGLRSSLELTAALIGVSRRGDLLYLTGGEVGKDRGFAWVTPDGRREPWSAAPGPYIGELDESEDGRVVALTALASSGLFEVWATEVSEALLRPVVTLTGMDCDDPVVGPAGRLIAARCIGDAERDGVYVTRFPPDGSPPTRVLDDEVAWVEPVSWVPGTRTLIARRGDEGTRELVLLDVGETGSLEGEPRLVQGASELLTYATVSPDRRHVALLSWKGQREASIAPWSDGVIGAPRPVATVSGDAVDWSARTVDGHRELILGPVEGVLSRALVDEQGRAVTIEPLPGYLEDTSTLRSAAFFGDGRMLLLELGPSERTPPSLRFVADWAATLEFD